MARKRLLSSSVERLVSLSDSDSQNEESTSDIMFDDALRSRHRHLRRRRRLCAEKTANAGNGENEAENAEKVHCEDIAGHGTFSKGLRKCRRPVLSFSRPHLCETTLEPLKWESDFGSVVSGEGSCEARGCSRQEEDKKDDEASVSKPGSRPSFGGSPIRLRDNEVVVLRPLPPEGTKDFALGRSVRPTSPSLPVSGSVVFTADILRMDFDATLGSIGGFDAVLMSPPWRSSFSKDGEECVRPRDLAGMEIPRRVMGSGFLFIWTDKECISRVFRLMRMWGFRFVESLVCVHLRGNHQLLEQPGRLISRSKSSLLMFRRGDRRLELRHQRNPDVLFTISQRDDMLAKPRDAVFEIIETLLPQSCFDASAGRGRFLELFAPDGFVGRRGWTSVVHKVLEDTSTSGGTEGPSSNAGERQTLLAIGSASDRSDASVEDIEATQMTQNRFATWPRPSRMRLGRRRGNRRANGEWHSPARTLHSTTPFRRRTTSLQFSCDSEIQESQDSAST